MTATFPSGSSAITLAVASATATARSRPGSTAAMTGGVVADPHGTRRTQVRRGRPHHAIGQRHDLGRDAVADRQADDPGRLRSGR